MNTVTLIPVVPTTLKGQIVQMVDARLLHEFLQSRQDYSTWIKSRIVKYGFERDVDYLLHKFVEQVPHQGSYRATARSDYFLTVDMAKELAMVERTPRGREARRYFIECERQLKRMQQMPASAVKAHPVALSRSERQAINRQAWADVAGEASRTFHARREELLRQYVREQEDGPVQLPQGFRPTWAQ